VAMHFGYEPVRLKFGQWKGARCNGRSNLPTGLAVIHGRDGAASIFGQKANTRSASDGAGIPAKGALCNIPAFVAFWSPSTIELRAGAGNLDRAPPIRALFIGRPSRLSLRLPMFLIIFYKGGATLFFRSKALNIDNGRIVYRQKSTIFFPSYIKAFASLLILFNSSDIPPIMEGFSDIPKAA
jgi:hypothetical protein